MERIKVTDIWRMMNTDTTFNMVFAYEADTRKALKAIEKVIKGINYENGYAALWLQDLEDSRTENGFEIESTLMCDEFAQYIPAMVKAVAEALPSVPFMGSATHDSLKCFYVHEYEFTYNDKCLYIKETFMDDENGYFCPDCGYFVAEPFAEFDSDEVECDDCGEVIKVADLKYVPPVVEENIFTF